MITNHHDTIEGRQQRSAKEQHLGCANLGSAVAPSRGADCGAPRRERQQLILAVLRVCGVELTLFHLVALILAAGLGLDYALFFDHAGDDYADQLRTLHALIVCSLMTLLVFTLLAFSSIPVLRAIGVTVALGVFGNFVLALLVSRQPTQAPPTTERIDAVA